MKLKSVTFIISGILFFAAACNSTTQPKTDNSQSAANTPAAKPKPDTVVISTGTNDKGIGRFKNVQLTHPLDNDLVAKGQALFESKCFACHKLTDEKLVGPGWKGVTDRHLPEWIMNFITNTQVMLDKDLAAQSEMVTCVVRMPNQNLTDDEARQILEFMRKNDGKN